jgi:hypothetical protein
MELTDSDSDPSTEMRLLEDPRVLEQFVPVLAEQHHPTGDPARGLCSCGEPYLACPVAMQIRPLVGTANEPAGASHWFG